MEEYLKEVAEGIADYTDDGFSWAKTMEFITREIKKVINRFAWENELPIPYSDNDL